jgi:hypothetical protein
MNSFRLCLLLASTAAFGLADTVTLTNGRLIYGECIALNPSFVFMKDKAPIDMSTVKSVDLDAATIQRLFSTEALEQTINIRKLSSELFRKAPTEVLQPVQVQQRNPLSGLWRFESSSLSHYEEIVLTLRDDGTYTKKFTGRMSSWSGGPTGGGTHDGSWQANGMVVRLSGDGNWPGSTHDLRSFQKLR